MSDHTLPEQGAESFQYAGFWLRALAIFVDYIIFMTPAYLLVQAGLPLLTVLRFALVLVCIVIVLCWWRWQATPGKMLISARILDARSGEAPSLGRCVLRLFGYLISWCLYVGFLWAAIDTRKQGWHDKIAGTVVVRKSSAQKARRAPMKGKTPVMSDHTLPEQDHESFEYAGFWLRAWALFVDSSIFAVLGVVLGVVLALAGIPQTAEVLLFTLALPGVLIVACWRYWRATPGKMLISAQIVNARNGGTPSLGCCVLRLFGYLLSTWCFYLGFLWAAFDNKKQGWHDKLAGTVVVRRRREKSETPLRNAQDADRFAGRRAKLF